MPAAAPVSAVFLCCAAFAAPAFFLFLQIPLYGFYVYFPAGESFLSIFLAYILTLRIPLRGVRFFLADSRRAFAFIFLSGFFFLFAPRSAAGTRTRKHKNGEHLCRGAHSAGFDESFFLNFRSVPRMCMFGRRIFFAVREKMGRPLKKTQSAA